MPLHYKKNGGLDMRYSSSRAAASSGRSSYSSSSRSSGGGGGGGLHYTNAGNLDMRYASSKAAAASAAPSRSSGGGGGGGLHYTNKGALDMRYASSKAAVAGGRAPVRAATSSTSRPSVMHYKKDGTLDMRYSSSQAAALGGGAAAKSAGRAAAAGMHYKKDGTLDMRFKSSREHLAKTGEGRTKLRPAADGLHYKKDGSLDMRFATSKHATAIAATGPPRERRRKYQQELCQDADFLQMACAARDHWDYGDLPPPQDVTLPAPASAAPGVGGGGLADSIGADVPKFEFSDLGTSASGELGSGAFGTVYAGTLPAGGVKVAVKKLHLGSVGKKKSAKREFLHEMKVMAQLGKHRNLIGLVGYCESPLAIVLEFAELGSLATILHQVEDKAVESNMLVGKLKKLIAYQVADGLRALHSVHVVHRDVKPDNVLLTKDYVPKLCDFGLSKLRGATVASVNSQATTADAGAGAAGTMAYMAPELLNFANDANEATDVYSFGVLLNELATMEQPYSDVAAKFVGRGADAPARYAAEGKRPELVEPEDASAAVSALIVSCWSADPKKRPTFAVLVTQFSTNAALVFVDQFDEDAAPALPAAVAQQLSDLKIR